MMLIKILLTLFQCTNFPLCNYHYIQEKIIITMVIVIYYNNFGNHEEKYIEKSRKKISE